MQADGASKLQVVAAFAYPRALPSGPLIDGGPLYEACLVQRFAAG